MLRMFMRWADGTYATDQTVPTEDVTVIEKIENDIRIDFPGGFSRVATIGLEFDPPLTLPPAEPSS